VFATATALFEDRLRDAGFGRVAGVDEAGRGALAGPLVAAAVILPRDCPIVGLADSKLLTPQRRAALAAQVHVHALAVAVVRVGPDTIDRAGLQRANIALLARALRELEGGHTITNARPMTLSTGTNPRPNLESFEFRRLSPRTNSASLGTRSGP